MACFTMKAPIGYISTMKAHVGEVSPVEVPTWEVSTMRTHKQRPPLQKSAYKIGAREPPEKNDAIMETSTREILK